MRNLEGKALPIVQVAFPPPKIEFNPRAFDVGFLVYIAAMGYLILQTLQFPS